MTGSSDAWTIQDGNGGTGWPEDGQGQSCSSGEPQIKMFEPNNTIELY